MSSLSAGGKTAGGRIVVQQRSASTLSDFRFHELLGRGSFGKVYRVTRHADGRAYVMKQINVAEMSEREQRDAVNEVQVMAAMDHANLVRYFDSFIDAGLLNIVMEFCDGGDLQAYLQKLKGRSLPEAQIWHLFIQICQGMAYMHGKRILHRDLKTANLFLSTSPSTMPSTATTNPNDAATKTAVTKPPSLVVKIGDLGVARVLNSSSSFAQTLVGTPYYLSPELCEDKPYNNRSDVWALGCILYELCSQRHPFVANNQGALILKIVRGKYPPLSAETYSPALRHLVKCMLSRSPARRPTVQHVLGLEAVRAWADKLGLGGQIPAPVPPVARHLVPSMPPVSPTQTRATRESTSAGDGKASVKPFRPRRAWCSKPAADADAASADHAKNGNDRLELPGGPRPSASSKVSAVAQARERAAQAQRERSHAVQQRRRQRHQHPRQSNRSVFENRRLPRARQRRGGGGNVRGTRIRGRRGQRVISSSVVGLGPTGTIRVRGNDGGGRGGGGGGNFGASRTVRGPVPGEVPRAADGSEWALGTRERGSMSSETSGAGANASRDPASEVKKPIRARPTIAQLRRAMTKTAERSGVGTGVSSAGSSGAPPGLARLEPNIEQDISTSTSTVEMQADSLDQSLGMKDESDLDFQASDDVDDEYFDAGEYVLYDEDEDEDNHPPSLFVQHVDVLWRVMEGDGERASSRTTSASSTSGEIEPVEGGIIDDATGAVVTESNNDEIANSMSLVAEELVNDMLDREHEISEAYQEKYEDCVSVFGDETAVATMISTIIHDENGTSLDFVRKLLPRRPSIESKMADGTVDDETASNALGLAVKLAALGEEKDQLERNIKSVLGDLEAEEEA